jgi:hypothetical protein
VNRDLDPASPLAGLLNEQAFGGMLDTRIRWAGGKYDMSAFFGMTHIRGSARAILAQAAVVTPVLAASRCKACPRGLEPHVHDRDDHRHQPLEAVG